jgi:hypothetical protein
MNHYLGVLLLISASQSFAEQAEEAIVRCAKLTSDKARIGCLENALRGAKAPAAETGAVAEAASGAAAGTPGSEASNVSSAAEPLNVVPEEPGPPAATAEPSEAGPPAAAVPETDADQFGLPPERLEADRPDQVVVTVTAVRENPYGKLIFTTSSGQTWVQTDQSRRRYRDVPFEAEIREGSSGSFFLRQASGGPSVRVRRQE